VPGPADRPIDLTGIAQTNRDSVDAITSRLPAVLGLIAVITFGLLFLLAAASCRSRRWFSTCCR
jgi:RND superfamily putative drug exporter